MESLRELKERAARMNDELVEIYKQIKDASESRFEDYEDRLYEMDEDDPEMGFYQSRYECAYHGYDGARDAIKELEDIRANTIVWQEY